MKKILLTSLVASAFALSASAFETGIVSHAEIGYINTTGNTETETFALDANMKRDWEKHAAIIKADAAYGKDTEVTTKNKFFVEAAYDYKFTETIAFNYLAAYKQDKFTDYNYQAYTGPGVKYKALKTEKQSLDLTASALYSFDQYVINDEDDNYASYKLDGVYDLQLLENLKFHQELSYRASFEDSDKYFINSKTALTTKVSDYISAGLSYKVDYINQVDADTEKSDNTLAFNLILDY